MCLINHVKLFEYLIAINCPHISWPKYKRLTDFFASGKEGVFHLDKPLIPQLIFESGIRPLPGKIRKLKSIHVYGFVFRI